MWMPGSVRSLPGSPWPGILTGSCVCTHLLRNMPNWRVHVVSCRTPLPFFKYEKLKRWFLKTIEVSSRNFCNGWETRQCQWCPKSKVRVYWFDSTFNFYVRTYSGRYPLPVPLQWQKVVAGLLEPLISVMAQVDERCELMLRRKQELLQQQQHRLHRCLVRLLLAVLLLGLLVCVRTLTRWIHHIAWNHEHKGLARSLWKFTDRPFKLRACTTSCILHVLLYDGAAVARNS